MTIKPVHYLQTDSRWKNHDYSTKGENTTIGRAGCGTTCAAMVIATLKDKNVDPVTTAEWSKAHGYKALNSGTYYSYFVPQFKLYGIDCARVNTSNLINLSKTSAKPFHEKALEALKSGKWLIVCVGKGLWTSNGHYILVYKYEDGYVYINDPASTRADKLKNTWSLLSSQAKYYWTIDVPNTTTTTTKVEAKKTEEKNDSTTKKTSIGLIKKLASATTKNIAKAGSYKTITDMNLRYGADSTKYDVVSVIKKGTIVKCYGFCTGKWLFVSANGKQGFMCETYLKKM